MERNRAHFSEVLPDTMEAEMSELARNDGAGFIAGSVIAFLTLLSFAASQSLCSSRRTRHSSLRSSVGTVPILSRRLPDG